MTARRHHIARGNSSFLSNHSRALIALWLFVFGWLSPIATLHAQQPATNAPPTTFNQNGFFRSSQSATRFKLERTDVGGEAELLTVFSTHDEQSAPDSSLTSSLASPSSPLATSSVSNGDVPLVSILRDTLGDSDPTNDVLRQVWMLTYTRPTMKQRLAAATPFLYARIGNKKSVGKGVPPAVIDLGATDRDVWQRFMWIALQSLVFDSQGFAVKASSRSYRRNISDYRKAHLIRALAVLALYEAQGNTVPAFTPTELHEISARLTLAETTFGGIIDDINLQRVHAKAIYNTEYTRGQNWELLRQRAEAEGLYFEPITTPDGTPTHAVVWARRDELAANPKRAFNKRFLNFDNPYTDKRLRNWQGYTATWHFDAQHERVSSDAEGARPAEMIPLALYGFDHPKIPIMLVDFRDRFNPKRREMSKRVLEDVARNVLAVSVFGDLSFFLGRAVYDFATGQRGADINQPSRLRAYSQLKLVLALDSTLDEPLREDVARRLETVSLNPMENDATNEARIAQAQYKRLIEHARKPDGLLAEVRRNRKIELRRATQSGTARTLTRLGQIASLGLYQPTGKWNGDSRERLELARQLKYHNRFLRQVAESSPRIEVVWDINRVRDSLLFIAEHGTTASKQTADATAKIFAHTEDDDLRRLCLKSLYRIDDAAAKSALVRINRDDKLAMEWRVLSRDYLRLTMEEARPVTPDDARIIAGIIEE
ncbi:MAG: hypothetical protein MSG64_15260 [Pyrinomonadaceae bacterium MAG19_C2-C3]|nr:hypothetical protein [Pyrinomonadaceae bacterium MAG19_C2-C3]